MKVPAKTPALVQLLGQGLIFKIPNEQREVYLTFDDGPIPGLTPWILDCLDHFQAKASFFMVGENVMRNPNLVNEILKKGHKVGNHSHNHLKGFKTKVANYLENIRLCQNSLDEFLPYGYEKIFRPPYGQITPRQTYGLKKLGYRIIMWDVLSKDYDPKKSPEQCVKNVLDNVEMGSIIVMHDNLKAERNVKNSLPAILEGIQKKGLKLACL